jgi:hypothetical protein
MEVTVAVATFGGPEWQRLAQTRALPSAKALGVPTVWVHAGTLHDARNEALAKVGTEWVIHLDADDELEPGYITALAAGTADVRAPAVRYVQGNRAGQPAMPKVAGHTHDCAANCLPYGNWLVVGAAVRAQLLRDIGGWRDFPVYEDWSTWLRCHLAGATFEAIPGAVYRAHVRRGSRNRGRGLNARLEAHRAIARDAGLDPALIP